MDERPTQEEGPRQPRRRPALIALAVALAIAAVPAGVAVAGSDGQSSGNTAVQDNGSGGDRSGERRDGHDCPKDRQGNDQQSTTQL